VTFENVKTKKTEMKQKLEKTLPRLERRMKASRQGKGEKAM